MSSSRGAIILARHGRPALDRSQSMDWRGYREWWAAYDAGGLADDQEPPEALIEAARQADVIYSSTLARSIETARRVANGKEVRREALFVEAPLPPPRLGSLKMRPRKWGVTARSAWWFGLSGGQESRVQAERRADAAVDFVEKEAAGGRTVLVCGHGWFNRMMRPVLLARGWRCVRDGRDGYWSFRRFERAGPER